MLNQKWSTTLFFLTTLAGTLISLSATNWISMYVGIELNLFAIIPLMTKTPNNKEYEAATKYFLTQALGSLLLLSSATWSNLLPLTHSSGLIMILSLMLKSGAAPLHFWFPNVMCGLNWHLCLLLATWQKLFPLLFLFNALNSPHPQALLTLFIFGATLGAIGGLNQTSLRGLLAYSSISHMGWMLSVALFSPLCATFYLFIYILTSSAIMLSLAPWFNLDTPKISSQITLSIPHKIIVTALFLSMAGLPPFLGFLPKWQIIDQLTTTSPWCVLPLLAASAMALFFYLKISFFILMTPSWTTSSHEIPLAPTAMTLLTLNMPVFMACMIF